MKTLRQRAIKTNPWAKRKALQKKRFNAAKQRAKSNNESHYMKDEFKIQKNKIMDLKGRNSVIESNFF